MIQCYSLLYTCRVTALCFKKFDMSVTYFILGNTLLRAVVANIRIILNYRKKQGDLTMKSMN